MAVGRSIGLVAAAASASVLHLGSHNVKSLGKVGLDAVGGQVLGSLLDALDLALHVPLFALGKASTDDVDHGTVETSIEVAAGGEVLFVAAIEAAMRVEVAAELEDEIKSVTWAGGKERQTLDVRQELEHGGCKVGGGDGVVEVILQAVEVEVDDGDLAVELGVQGHGTVGGSGVHDLCNGGGHVYGRLAGWQTRCDGTGRTWAQSSLVDPAVDLGALLLQLLDPVLHVGELALELLNLLGVGPYGLVEGLGKKVGHGLRLDGAQRRSGLAQGGAVDAVGHTPRILGLLGLLGPRIHFLVGRGREVVLVGQGLLGMGRFRTLLLVLVVGLGALRGIVFDVAVSPRAALEEHSGKRREGDAERGGRWNGI